MTLCRRALFRCLLLLLAALCLQAGQTQPAPHTRGPGSAAYRQAFNLLQNGKAQEAMSVIDAALARAPADAELHNLRALAALKLGRAKEAEASFRRVIELQPSRPLGYNNLATLLLQLGRAGEAVEAFREALRRDPRNFPALLGLAKTLTALKKYSEAKPYLEKALAERPGDFEASYDLALVQRALQDLEAAQRTLENIRPPREPSVEAKYYALAAVIAQDRGRLAEALKLYRRAHTLYPDSFDIYVSLVRATLDPRAPKAAEPLPSPPARLNAEQHFALGLLFASQGASAEAIPQFEETLRLEPASYSAAFNLALAYRGAGQPQAAIDLIRKVLKEKPTAELHNLLASLEETTGDYLGAARDYQRAVELEPTNEQYYFDLGMEYLVHFTFDPAQEVFRVGAQKFSNSVRQHVGLGYAHYGMREYLPAAEAFLDALEIAPSSPTAYAAWNSLPAFLAPAEAERILPRLRRLAELYPQSAEAQYCYGVLLLRNGQANDRRENIEEARPLLERAIALKPGLADAHLELGNLFVALKQNEKAVTEFKEGVRLNPRSEMGHYRLGQIYRNLHQLELAQKELALYTQLTHTRRELMARNRAAISQFILTQTARTPEPGKSEAPAKD